MGTMKRVEITRRKTRRLSEYDQEFEVMKALVYERAGGACEAVAIATLYGEYVSGFLDIACGKGVHVHHRKYRQRGGTNSLDNLMLVCWTHHEWIHAHGGFGQAANRLRLALSADEGEELE